MASSESSQPLAPATSVTMQNLYLDVFQPLFFPAPSEFIQPLLDSFVVAQDELLEDNSLFTIPTRTREIGVEIDGIIREFRRRESSTVLPSEMQEADQTSLGEQAGPKDESGQILRRFKERIEKFDREMKQLEEAALKDFKEGIRKAVAVSAK
ncbi:hypothetical protein BDD12DRAFT_800514 [Trichophaea hybrida]|nr:hypothetical protein BDD12DRAFT_800514 [Trichophaea hybrida]